MRDHLGHNSTELAQFIPYNQLQREAMPYNRSIKFKAPPAHTSTTVAK